ncbi:50S ribosomal protein L15 [Candidatus Providencia siddallii]|uniref:Large ribosomal subunit protein uL15 n=1 Tax=Candidatus Providencia siddallii TaxID=1715285 RepID=A0A0M6W7V6_9GAMM|nr:50S ribosomal protein L15 [Candidatus Providencia siddallii]
MYLNNISPAKGSKHNHKRVGRGIGSGLGKTSGRGHKGQKSRAGGKIHRGFEGGQMPLYRRLPKFGFNSHKKIFNSEISLSDISTIKSQIIDLNTLKTAKIIKTNIKYAKIILSGKINHAVTIRGIGVTKGARIAIESIGGRIKEVNI